MKYLLILLLLAGCKSINDHTMITETVYDDGEKIKSIKTTERKITDNSFTLGGSEGDGKTLMEISIGNVN
jgi:uncharacterized protein YcfL